VLVYPHRSLDPYTEYESAQDATDLTESIDGRYAGVGLVIAGNPAARSDTITSPKLLPAAALEDAEKLEDGDMSSSSNVGAAVVEEEEELDDFAIQQNKELSKVRKNGIRIINAFEGYAFDYGLRVGDKLVAIDDRSFTEDTTVESVRNQLRGEPGTLVSLSIERVGVPGVQTVTMPRQIVRIRDVKLATLVGNPSDGVGYIQLSGFASDAGREVRSAVAYLQRAAEDATDGERSLQGLILDMRGNPGGLLTSAVDVASLLVPKGSDIVSAKGRGFPGILYRSRVDPILGSNTKLAVLVNGGTASAAEIVSGAVQDLDAGIIVGSDRTFGKGLVQNVEELPFNSALKFTVAKYYTPSGRCIQGINYKEGGGRGEEDSGYVASKVLEKDRTTYYTRLGRAVRDGGGVEADFKVEAPKASALEITLLRSGLLSDFAAEWSKNNELGNNFRVDDEMYRNFQAFVTDKEKQGDIKLEALYGKSLSELKTSLKRSGYKGSEKVLENLQTSIIRDIHRDFDKYSSDIKEDISVSILARYVPESHLIERGLKTDKQVQAAVKLVANGNQFDTLLAAGNTKDGKVGHDTLKAYASPDGSERLSGKVKW
jgi:carboxyl-terminal processing protease